MNQYQELLDILIKARQRILWPAIHYTSNEGQGIRFSLASKGYIAIKVDGEYAGKIYPNDKDEWELKLYSCSNALTNEIEQFCKTPIASAKVTGQRYNYCCFCNKMLLNRISVHHGYGPICAENFGLPWEDIAASNDEDM